MKLNDRDLCSIVNAGVADRLNLGDIAAAADDYYLCKPRGDEEIGYSSFISSQVADVIDADLPTLARIFLGAGQCVEFMPNDEDDQRDAQEAEDKTVLVDKIIRGVPDYYRTMHAALMGVALHPVSVLRYGFEERKRVKIRKHDDITAEEMAALDADYRSQFEDVTMYDVAEDEDEEGFYTATWKLVNDDEAKAFIRRIPLADFVISYDANSKGEARIIGEVVMTRRGELLAAGYSRAQIDMVSSFVRDSDRWADAETPEWASQIVEGFDGFVRVDYNGDGIAELRRVVKYGDEIFENEEIEDDERAIEFAIGTATLFPDSFQGVSRAERVTGYQDAMTTLSRAMLDNTAQMTRGRLIVNTSSEVGLNYNDVTGDGGLIRANPMPGMTLAEAAVPLPVQPVATEAITVIQYLDSQRAQSTGSLLANQGLKADSLHKETATRFNGIDDSAQAKVELMVRTIAETMMRELYEGMCYYAQKYAEPMGDINPKQWSIDHCARVAVGTGFGDNDKTQQTLAGLLQLSTNLQGTPLSDSKKLYNIIAKMAKASGIYNVADYFNDPEIPQQTLMATVEQLQQALQQANQTLQQNDPLIQLETIRAQAKLQQQAMANEIDAMRLELDKYKAISANALKLTELEQAAGRDLSAQTKENMI
jgi:hypothetical protein